MTGRNVQDEAKKAGLPWTAAKGTHHDGPGECGTNDRI